MPARRIMEGDTVVILAEGALVGMRTSPHAGGEDARNRGLEFLASGVRLLERSIGRGLDVLPKRIRVGIHRHERRFGDDRMIQAVWVGEVGFDLMLTGDDRDADEFLGLRVDRDAEGLDAPPTNGPTI